MSLYRAGSITVASRELTRYKLCLLGVQEVRLDNGGSVRAGIIIFYMKKERKLSLGNRILCKP